MTNQQFDEQKHSRAGAGQKGKFRGGEFAPKGQAAAGMMPPPPPPKPEELRHARQQETLQARHRARRSVAAVTHDEHKHGPRLEQSHERYFNQHPAAREIPIERLHAKRHDPESAKRAAEHMKAAHDGDGDKRAPLLVSHQGDDHYRVEDGNATYHAAKQSGWDSLPAVEVQKDDVDPKGRIRQGSRAESLMGDQDPAKRPLFSEEEVGALPARATQKVKDPEQLYRDAHVANDHMATLLNRGSGICSRLGFKTHTPDGPDPDLDEPGGILMLGPVKSRERAERKVEHDYAGDWSQVKDLARASIAVDSMDEIHSVVQAIRGAGVQLAQRPKDKFQSPSEAGYRDANLSLVMPNGHVTELQVHCKPILRAKREAHQHYAAMQALDRLSGQDGRPLNPGEQKRYADALGSMRGIYAGAWASVSGQQKASLQKSMSDQLPDRARCYDWDGMAVYCVGGLDNLSSDPMVWRGGAWQPARNRAQLLVHATPIPSSQLQRMIAEEPAPAPSRPDPDQSAD